MDYKRRDGLEEDKMTWPVQVGRMDLTGSIDLNETNGHDGMDVFQRDEST